MRFRKPMLAKEYEGNEHKVVYPCYVQPKLDGVRCITNGQTFWSRNGKMFPRQNFKHLQTKPFPYLVDGELSLTTGLEEFEEIVSVVKRTGHERSKFLCFHAFDVMTNDPYAKRKLLLQSLFESRVLSFSGLGWNRLTTRKIDNPDELRQRHEHNLAMKYEGTMIRNAFGLYVPTRTIDLLKWKSLKEDEFEIHDVKEAKGKDAGTPIFVCLVQRDAKGTPVLDYVTFRARPKGTMEQRRQMWKERKKLRGKMLTVEFQNLTRYGVPRFPRAKVLRDYE